MKLYEDVIGLQEAVILARWKSAMVLYLAVIGKSRLVAYSISANYEAINHRFDSEGVGIDAAVDDELPAEVFLPRAVLSYNGRNGITFTFAGIIFSMYTIRMVQMLKARTALPPVIRDITVPRWW